MAFNTVFHSLSFHTKNLEHIKPRGLGYKQWIYQTTCPHPRARGTACTKPRAHTWQINCNIIPQKDTMIPYVSQPRYPLNNQILAIFFPFATIPATSHYPEFTDTYSPHYRRLSFSLHFMTNILFFWPSFANFHIIAHGTASPILCTSPSLTPLTEWAYTPTFPQQLTLFRLCRSSKCNVPG